MISNWKINIYFLFLALACGLGKAHAQDAVPPAQDTAAQQLPVLSLDTILSRIAQAHPAMQGYDYRIEARERYAEGARSWMAPMLGGGTFMTPYPGSSRGDTRGMLMLSAEQAIPHPARQRARQAYLNAGAAIDAAEKGVVFNDLRAEARSLYYQWLVMERKKALLLESERLIKTLHKLAQIRYPYEKASLGSIYKAEGRLHEIENRILEADNGIAEKQIMLNSLMKVPAQTRYRIDTAAGSPAARDTATLLQRRSDLQALSRRIEQMELGLQLERAERQPEFSLRFEHMSPYSDMMPAQYSLMGMITIPIAPWSAGKYRSRIRGMEMEIRSMEMMQEAILQEARGKVLGMENELQLLRRQLANYQEKIIPALRKNYESTLLAYEQNQESLDMVIDAWEALDMARIAYLDKLEGYYLKKVAYEKELEE